MALTASRDRLRYWSLDSRMRHASLFKNSGPAAGASLEHVHSQLIVLPEVAESVQQELDHARRYWQVHTQCVYCDLIRYEQECRERLVLEDPFWIAFTAYAGRQPYETWLLPKQHQANFETISDDQMATLGLILHQLLVRLNACIPEVSYNLVLHTAPFHGGYDSSPCDSYHWHWELIPRTSELAGLELGAGIHINSLSPERAAQSLQRT